MFTQYTKDKCKLPSLLLDWLPPVPDETPAGDLV